MPTLISLVPNSAVHFWDADIDLERLPNRRRTFWEEPISQVADATGRVPAVLRELVEDEATREMVDPATGRAPPEEETYAIGRAQALEMVLGKWLPLPYFLVMARGPDGRESYDRGPTNWVRIRLTELGGQAGRTHRLTFAFDTALLPRNGELYVAPTPQNAERQQEFAYVESLDQNGWFLNEDWLNEWLEEMLRELQQAKRGGRPLTAEDFRRGLEHLARYLVFLQLIELSGAAPRIRLIDTVSSNVGYSPVQVDLVLDIGNARTCGLLIEEHPGQGMNLSDSYPLALRDLSRPELMHVKPFESRVEFARASFGRDAVSRRSGRAAAFAWPSPLRVGPEAVRLASTRQGNEGATGLSSPKRYLWDERLTTQGWRFNGRGMDGVTTDPPVSGAFMALVGEDGTVLRGRPGQPAVRARFSRSALFTFMLAEIILQALCQMNAPATRAGRRDADKPRRLRRVLLTLPPGMPVFEQQILRQRAVAAVRLAWDMLGWGGTTPAQPEPRVIANLDEATATQVVWLHNEVAERLAGDAQMLLDLMGRERPELEEQGRSLRIASIDIGGGTTDLMITTFTRPHGEMILPRQEFRESFKIAGDDVLERVISAIVAPAIERALGEAGAAQPQALLTRSLSQDLSGQTEQERQARRVFVAQVLEPVALAVLAAYERTEAGAGEIMRSTIGDILRPDEVPVARLARKLDEAAAAAGAAGFAVADVPVVVDARRVETAIQSVLGRVLADLCEVVWHYDCDVLLLSGRPSRLRAVSDMVFAKMPVPPHRIVGMHRYRVGDRYPFRDASNRIDDPKTTAAVGAMLCVLAEGRLKNFMLRASQLAMRSTLRIIGRMANDGQIRDDGILLADADLDGKARRDSFTVSFQAATQIGFRQLPIARWTATPLYMMEFANPDTAPRLALPLRVTVRRAEEEPDVADVARAEAAREQFRVEEIEDATGARLSNRDVVLRLQTLDDQDGYWRDTGKIALG